MLPCARTWLFLIALLFWLASCDFFGPDEEASGYYLYVGNWGEDEVFVVDANTNQVVRTLKGFDSVWTLAVSDDGATLYVGTRGFVRDDEGRVLPGPVGVVGGLYAVDTRSWRIRKLLDKSVDVFAGTLGHIVFVEFTFDVPGQPVGLIETRTSAITFLDTLDIVESGLTGLSDQGLVFHPTRPIFYTLDTQRRLFAYDYEQREVLHTYESREGIFLRNMVISPDGKSMYVAGGPVLDLEQDAIVAWVGGNHLGSLVLSPSGDTLYVTDPGVPLRLAPVPSGKVFIFDTRSNHYVAEIDVAKATPSGLGTQTDTIVLSPDGKTAYVSNWLDLVFVIDLTAGKVIDLIQPRERAIQTIPLALGPKP